MNVIICKFIKYFNRIEFSYCFFLNYRYISTKSMILVMFIQTYTTIRSVFSKASDLPITIERLNATTYVYPTIKKYSGRFSPVWMFNFLSFNGKLRFLFLFLKKNFFYCRSGKNYYYYSNSW